MGFLARIFGTSARKDYFPPPPADAPPQPQGEWNIVVNASGDRVTNRPPAATDFLARRPVDYIDGGTEPAFKKDPRLDEPHNALNLVDYEMRRERNREHLQKAVFLLSQTDDGRRLLHLAKDLKFKLVFDSDACAEANAVGICDYANKKIPLAEGRSAAEVALTLKHELQHMEDIKNGLDYNLNDTPRSAILANRALEGNARVSEAVAVAESLIGSPRGPERQFRTAALFNCMWNKLPEMAQATDAAMKDAAEGKWTSFAAKIFPAYFSETRTLAFYDDKYFQFIDKYVPDVSDSIAAVKKGYYDDRGGHNRRVETARGYANMLFTDDRWTPEKIAKVITIRQQAYLPADVADKKSFSLGNPAATALTPDAPALFAKLKENIKALLPESDKGALLDLPVMQQKPSSMPKPSPYGAHHSQLEPEAFTPIRMPDRIDGDIGSDGVARNAFFSKYFTDMKTNMPSGQTEIDRVNYTVLTYISHNKGIANLRGLVGNLLEAGLRAPIGAFPYEYLQDLWGRAVSGVRYPEAENRSSLSPQELKLFGHWKQMQENGMDPMWIDKDNKQLSWVARDSTQNFYGQMLADMIGEPPADARGRKPPEKALKS